LGTLKWDLKKKDFENLGIVIYSTKMLSQIHVLENGEKEEEDL
jgi:hypothetical protein